MSETESAGAIRFGGALQIANVFKVLAGVTLVLGVLSMVAILADDSDTTDTAAGVATVAGTIVSASMLAFLGYVLEILVELYDQAWSIRAAVEEDEE